MASSCGLEGLGFRAGLLATANHAAAWLFIL